MKLLDASPFERINNIIKTFIRMKSMRKDNSTEEAGKAMYDTVEDETKRDGKRLNNRPARLARDGFRICLAGVESCLCESLAHLAPDARVYIFNCVLEHF